MSWLNDLMGKVLGQGDGTEQPEANRGLLDSVMGMVRGSGGLGGLLERFQQGGLGEAVQSWISTGANQPVSGEQVQASLGADKIGEIARSVGLSVEQTAGGLARLLPSLVDKLTPDGKLPDAAGLGRMLASLKGDSNTQTP